MRSARPESQPEKALALLRRGGLTRLSEFRRARITAVTISRLEAAGTITRLARGLYRLTDADVDANHTLVEASKLVPKGVICQTSALAYHDLTGQIPAAHLAGHRPERLAAAAAELLVSQGLE